METGARTVRTRRGWYGEIPAALQLTGYRSNVQRSKRFNRKETTQSGACKFEAGQEQ